MLQQGDLIGQYSCLDSKTFNFEAYVISKEATVFELERRFFDTFQHKIEGLQHAVQFANELILEDGVPI